MIHIMSHLTSCLNHWIDHNLDPDPVDPDRPYHPDVCPESILYIMTHGGMTHLVYFYSYFSSH